MSKDRAVREHGGVARQIDIDDVLTPPPGPGLVLRRGCAKKCPRCGGGKIYDGWFTMRDRCPTCGYLFEREPGFFVGAYLINFAIAEGILFVLIMGYVLWKNANPQAGLTIPIGVGASVAVLAPIAFYPFSRTVWSAIDLIMTPLEMDEIVAAAEAADGAGKPTDPAS